MNAAYDYIEINEQLYRVEFNMEAIANFLEKQNMVVADLDQFATLTANQIVALCYEGICSGCRCEKKEFPFSYAEFARAIRLPVLQDLLLIYQLHSTGDKELKKKINRPKPKRLRRLILRILKK